LPFANNNGFRIHYQVSGSSGPALILQHGLTMSGEDWKRLNYVKKIANNFLVILIDARGHGLSDKSYDPNDYRLSTRAMDVVTVMDHMGIDKTHYWGFSMGASIGYGLMLKAPNRIDRMVLGGQQPYEVSAGGPIHKALKQGPQAFLKLIESSGVVLAPERRDEILAMDTEAVSTATTYPDESDVIVPAMRNFNRPTLIYSGDLDHNYELISSVSKDNPKFEMISLKGLDHIGSWASVNKVTDIATEFLTRQFDELR